MSRRLFAPRALLCLALLALLCISCVSAFNPYADDDDAGVGEAPSTSTLTCTRDPVTGEEKCESVAKIVPDEAELAAKIAAAEEARAEAARIKAEAKAARDAKYQAEREAKREARKREIEEKEAELRKEQGQKQQQRQQKTQDDYKIVAPLKKLRMNYYKFFGVEQDDSKLKIRKAVNAMAVANHPDKCSTQQCRDNIVVINQARDVLLNDETRREYDFLLKYGFKVYDKALYEDMYKQYLEDPDNMPNGFASDRIADPGSDYSSMNLTEESAGWLLALCGAITLGMIAVPVVKMARSSGDADAKKAAAKKALLAEQVAKKRALEAEQAARMKGAQLQKEGAERRRAQGDQAQSTSAKKQ